MLEKQSRFVLETTSITPKTFRKDMLTRILGSRRIRYELNDTSNSPFLKAFLKKLKANHSKIHAKIIAEIISKISQRKSPREASRGEIDQPEVASKDTDVRKAGSKAADKRKASDEKSDMAEGRRLSKDSGRDTDTASEDIILGSHPSASPYIKAVAETLPDPQDLDIPSTGRGGTPHPSNYHCSAACTLASLSRGESEAPHKGDGEDLDSCVFVAAYILVYAAQECGGFLNTQDVKLQIRGGEVSCSYNL